MLSIKVDEGYAYDYLSILYIKNLKFNTEFSNQCYSDCLYFIELQIGKELNSSIMSSEQYMNLVDANLKTFDAVEMARYGSISAKEVDNLNMLRFKYKTELQNKFFPNTKIAEFKS
jgi:small nuclear ribonucleoprotein (snRNP)-like protein